VPESTRSSGARPVTPLPPSRLDFHSFEFHDLYFGREGPNYAPIKSEPSKGSQQYVRARLFGQEAIATAKFEAIDEQGNVLKLLHLFKARSALDDGGYWGWVEVPTQPFRIMVSGQDINSAPYKRIHPKVFQPQDESPAPPLLPPGIPAA